MNPAGKNTASSVECATGNRCRTNRLIRTHAGNVMPAAIGTILSEVDNLGRHMLQVRWDGGLCAYVFPEEIEIVTTNQ
jgi:hypothetical protein